MTHIMLDLETLGTKPGCVILSIGACVFYPNTGPDEEKTFYAVLNRDDQLDKEMVVDPKTLSWWTKQNKKAWDQATKFSLPTEPELKRFLKWWHSYKGKYLWSQGSNFDGPLLEALFASFGLKEPWRFYDTRDTRTVKQMCHVKNDDVKRDGTYHNALDDALHQSREIAFGIRKIAITGGSWYGNKGT